MYAIHKTTGAKVWEHELEGKEPAPAYVSSIALGDDDLYFVSKGDGTHYFSKSLREHNRAVRRYILNKK